MEWIFDPELEIQILIKLGISAVLGLIIGIEREMKRKPVGLKTTLVISIISCLLTVVSIESAYMFPGSDDLNVTMDPLRLAAQIVSGIGFLGAGVILRRDNNSISGLTTAAIIWGAAGIGIGVGAGFYIESIAGVILLIISVEIIPATLKVIGPKQLREKEIMLKLIIHEKEDIAKVMEMIQENKISVKNIRIKDLDENRHSVQLRITVDQKLKTTDVYYTVSNIEEIAKVEIENL
ncbi:MgtC/SapB family protein [Peribacillus glennii]|uniref:MgtC/SapB family protein n=1 Tax=Peribacillus glennii TaxID=2303991 RepID=A0A372LDC4_9BACI|nr:MgtC/SapB family protein [Peribacillus glennii]RFU63992.1 MgtC/SapB family protein [Peribacillus glennii]